jgi:SRSO17 transposase
MTDDDFRQLAPCFARYLLPYRRYVGEIRCAYNVENYCRGLLSDEPRKSIEPLALRCGAAVRSLQCFLKDGEWDHLAMRDEHQRTAGKALAAEPDPEGLGTIGLIDETSCLKKGDQTPGVQRQYLGCVGKLDNGIVTVHLAATRGDLKVLLDSDLFLPQKWDRDRDRCRKAGIPDDVRYAPKWRQAFFQYVRARENGLKFDGLVFDEGYGGKPAFLRSLHALEQRFVGEVPTTFSLSQAASSKRRPAREWLVPERRQGWKRLRVEQATGGERFWWYRSMRGWVRGMRVRLVVAVDRRSGEVKYFVTNAVGERPQQILRVAFRRAVVEHLFRLAKQEVGLMHYEGRHYRGLMRHQILALLTLGFVSLHTARLRKKMPN